MPDLDFSAARRANIKNIITKLTAGKTLTAEDKRTIEEFEAETPGSQPSGNSVATAVDSRGLTPAKLLFVQLVAGGATQADAYRQAFKKPKASSSTAREAASRHMADERAKAVLADLRGRTMAKTILSLNDRLSLLAANAQLPSKTAAARNAQARAIEVYSKISGDQAPERGELVVKGDPTAPLHTVNRNATKAEKIAAARAARALRGASGREANVLAPAAAALPST